MTEIKEMKEIKEAKKLAFFLPNIFTALNIACGFTSVIYSWQGLFYQAAMILVLGAIFDMVDGRVARMTGTQSAFGEQFDSLSDVVSFGFAPAMMVYAVFFSELGRVGLVVSFIFLLCGALRLARFNANIGKVDPNFFQGLPIPGAAFALVGYVLMTIVFPTLRYYPLFAGIYVVVYALLMISNIPFPSFKKSEWVKKRKKRVLAIIFLILTLTFMYEEIMIISMISFYVIGSIAYFIYQRKHGDDVFEWENENEKEIDEE